MSRRNVRFWFNQWMWDNSDAIHRAEVERAGTIKGPSPRTLDGRIRRNTYRCEPQIALTRDAYREFFRWLYLEDPFQGLWTTLEKGAGLEGDVFVFTLFEDALLMRLRWGSIE